VADPDLPLVAGWRYGLGSAVAVTTDPLGGWAESWRGTGLVPALVERTARPSALSGARAETVWEEGGLGLSAQVAADAAEVEGWLHLPGGEGRPVRLRAAGQGRFRAVIGSPSPGAGRLTLRAGGAVLDGGLCIPHGQDYAESGSDPAGLSELRTALGDGGRGAAERNVGWIPAALALVLFLLDRLLLATGRRRGPSRAPPGAADRKQGRTPRMPHGMLKDGRTSP
jgi:hypothetical protein